MATLSADGLMISKKMHQRITCRTLIVTPDTAGEQLETLQDIAVVWAEVMASSGEVNIIARQTQMVSTYKVRMRYQEKLLATRNIIWLGVEYRVLSLLNPDNRKHILEMSMVEDHL